MWICAHLLNEKYGNDYGGETEVSAGHVIDHVHLLAIGQHGRSASR